MTPEARIQIPAELLSPAETATFEGTWALDVLAAGPDEYRFAEPLSWRVEATNAGDCLLVRGEVRGQATGTCARCLEEFPLDLEGEVEGCFLFEQDGSAPEGYDPDEFSVLPADHEIDLAPLFVAGLLLELPLVPLCGEDCKGLCPTCGANLNEGACACQAARADGAPADKPPATLPDGRPNPFAVLKDYPFDDASQR